MTDAGDDESAAELRRNLRLEWREISSTRRLFVALSETGETLAALAGRLGQAAEALADPRCLSHDDLMELVAEHRDDLDDANAMICELNTFRKDEGLAPLPLEEWLGPIHECEIRPFERVLLAGTVYEIWIEASAIIGEHQACEIIRAAFPEPPPGLFRLGRIPGYLVGKSKQPADKNPRHWPHIVRGGHSLAAEPHPSAISGG